MRNAGRARWLVTAVTVTLMAAVPSACGDLRERDACTRWASVQDLVAPYRDIATTTATVSQLRDAADRLDDELRRLDDATEHRYSAQIATLAAAAGEVRDSVVDLDGDRPVAGQAALTEDAWDETATAYSDLESAIGPTCQSRGNDGR